MARKKILVVEDDEITRHFLRNVLTAAEYEVFTAGDVGEAMSLAVAKRPDLITLDVHLSMDSPGQSWDGFHLAPWLRQMNGESAPPAIIIITATVDPDEAVEKMLKSGVHTYMVKPVDRAMLLKVVAEALNASSSN